MRGAPIEYYRSDVIIDVFDNGADEIVEVVATYDPIALELRVDILSSILGLLDSQTAPLVDQGGGVLTGFVEVFVPGLGPGEVISLTSDFEKPPDAQPIHTEEFIMDAERPSTGGLRDNTAKSSIFRTTTFVLFRGWVTTTTVSVSAAVGKLARVTINGAVFELGSGGVVTTIEDTISLLVGAKSSEVTVEIVQNEAADGTTTQDGDGSGKLGDDQSQIDIEASRSRSGPRALNLWRTSGSFSVVNAPSTGLSFFGSFGHTDDPGVDRETTWRAGALFGPSDSWGLSGMIESESDSGTDQQLQTNTYLIDNLNPGVAVDATVDTEFCCPTTLPGNCTNKPQFQDTSALTTTSGCVIIDSKSTHLSCPSFNETLGINGDPSLCPVIPTVSEWGVIAMTFLLLTAGTIVFGRQRRPAAV